MTARLLRLISPLLTLSGVLCASVAQGQAPPAGPPTYRVRLAYFVPQDRRPTAHYEQKIRVIAALVSDLYARDLRGKGYRTEGLSFEPKVKLVRGAQPAAYYNGAPAYNANGQWRRLLPEIRAGVGDPQRQVIVVFTETYDEGPAPHLWPGVIARGAYHGAEGGLAVFSAHTLRDELCATTVEGQRRIFFDLTPVPGRKAFGRPMNSARGEFAEDGVGAVAHEMGHALGLPHDRRQDDRDLMGNGFRNLRWNFEPGGDRRMGFSEENARLLMTSRYLAADLRLPDQRPPEVEAAQTAADAQSWTVRITAADETGLRALVVVDRSRRTVIAGRAFAGARQTILQRIPRAGTTGPEARLQILVADSGGNQTRTTLGPPGAAEE